MTIIVVISDVFYVCALCVSELGFIVLTTNYRYGAGASKQQSSLENQKHGALIRLPNSIRLYSLTILFFKDPNV